MVAENTFGCLLVFSVFSLFLKHGKLTVYRDAAGKLRDLGHNSQLGDYLRNQRENSK